MKDGHNHRRATHPRRRVGTDDVRIEVELNGGHDRRVPLAVATRPRPRVDEQSRRAAAPRCARQKLDPPDVTVLRNEIDEDPTGSPGLTDGPPTTPLWWLAMRIMEPAAFIMTRRFMFGINQRAERCGHPLPQAPSPPYPVTLAPTAGVGATG